MITLLDSSLPTIASYKPPVLCLEINVNRFFFSVEAVKLLGLENGSKITFAFDSNDPGIVYFYLSPTGFTFREVKTRAGSTRLCSMNAAAMYQLRNFLKLKKNESFRITNETTLFNGRNAWFITKK